MSAPFTAVMHGVAQVWAEPTLLVTAAPDGPIAHDGVVSGTVDVAVGGSGFATAYALAACGWPTELWAPVPAGDSLVADAAGRAGLTLRPVTCPELRSTVSLVAPDGARSMVSGRSTVFDEPHADQVPDPSGAVLHVSLSSVARDRTGAVRRLLARSTAPLSIDLGSPSAVAGSGLDELCAQVRPMLVVANADEAEAAGWTTCPDGVGVLVVKHGGGPAVAHLRDGSRVECAPAPTAVVDTTGAGDAFAAGLLHGMLSGAGLHASLARAHRVAAAAIDHVGPVVTLPVDIARGRQHR